MDFGDGDEIKEELDRILMEELGKGAGGALLVHALSPRNWGGLSEPDGEAVLTGICEDTVRVQIRLQGDCIQDIRFMTNGCAATVACGSMVTELARGKTLGEALKIDGETVREAFGGLPREHSHCADLAANALQNAVRDALEVRRAPWKRFYRPSAGQLNRRG